MAYFAKINNESIVEAVIAIPDHHESNGLQFINEDLKLQGHWIRTSFNGKIRKQFAGKNYIYDKNNDIFIAPQPFESWTLDENFDWQPPKPKPEGFFIWDEEQLDWVNAQTL